MKYLIKILIDLILSFTIILSWVIKKLDSYYLFLYKDKIKFAATA